MFKNKHDIQPLILMTMMQSVNLVHTQCMYTRMDTFICDHCKWIHSQCSNITGSVHFVSDFFSFMIVKFNLMSYC